ncbi:MAG: hypothetical protein ACYTGZ_07550 [Planctomycetota bacterium]|jgi:hypothetical protein
MWSRLPFILETAEQAEHTDRGWLVIAVVVLVLVARHAVIAFLSRSDRRR